VAPRISLAVWTAVAVLAALAVAGLTALLARVADVLVLVLVAAILAAGLVTPVEALRRRELGRRGWRLGRGPAVALVLFGASVAALIAAAALISPLLNQVDAIATQAPATIEAVAVRWDALRQRYPWLPDLSAWLGQPLAAGERLGAVLGAVELELLPAAARRRAEAVAEEIEIRFGGWVRGQLVLCVMAGVAAGLGTWALGLPYPLLLGLFAGLTMLIPMIGPALGAVPAVLIAAFGPWERLVATVVVFVAIFQVEMNVVVPRVMARAVGLSPLLTIIAVAAGAALLGMAGALLAVPVAAAVQVVLGEMLRPARR
jgi:predicted PurR-regulated permease PerM